MTWTKISDDFTDDTWSLSDKAYRLHTEGLIWSNRKLLDNVIPKDDVRRFAKHPDAVTELVAGGWWSDGGEVWIIRHHAGYQESRDKVIARQERARTNGARGGRPPKQTRERFDGKPKSVTQQQTHGDGTGRAGTGETPMREKSKLLGPTSEWPVVPIHRGPVCDVCLMPMPKDAVLTICEVDDPAHEDARMASAS